MGSIIKRPGKYGARFYLHYTDVDGKQKTRAARGAINQKHAQRMLAEIERNVLNGRLGIEEPTEADLLKRSITIKELGEKFLKEYSDPGIKDLEEYRRYAKSKLNVRIYPLLGDRTAASLTLHDLKRFRDAMAEAPFSLKPASVTLTLAVLSKMYTWANEAGYVDCHNPVKGCKRPRATSSLDYFSKAEVVALLAQAQTDAPRIYPMVACAVYSGLRLGELLGLRWNNVRLDAGRIDVMHSYDKLPKSGKHRHIPAHPELAPILRMWKEQCPQTKEGLVFPVSDAKGEWHMGTVDSLRDVLQKLLKAAACHVPAKPWHALRHTFASHFMMDGGNILSLQKLLGHGTLTMTLIYAHLSPDHLATEVARMSFAAPTPAGVVSMASQRGLDRKLTQEATIAV